MGKYRKRSGNLLSKLGCHVLAFDKYKAGFGSEWIHEVSEKELLEKATLISLHVPLTEETRGYYNSAWFKQAKSMQWLINTSRGNILNLIDLKNAMENNGLIGAALDVLPEETPSQWNDSIYAWLQQHPNIVLTPHIAGWTKESHERIAHVLIEKINQFL
jgi:D-3-phosphoglycerate dehydrogenase